MKFSSWWKLDSLTSYYINQGGSGLGDLIGPVYLGAPYSQLGHGIGGFLTSLFRIVKPILLSGARASLKKGVHILSDKIKESNKRKKQGLGIKKKKLKKGIYFQHNAKKRI